jgi:hypothetical protein
MDQIYTDSTDAPVDPPRTLVKHADSSPLGSRDPFTSSHRHRTPPPAAEARLAELESENRRLHALVAELLLKNQQLRRSDVNE